MQNESIVVVKSNFVKKIMAFSAAVVAMMAYIMLASFSASAEENMTPSYEVKFLLDDSQVLNDDYLLKKSYRDLFQTGKNEEKVGVLYLETETQEFGAEGWINRIRAKENANEFELAYKKRYAIEKVHAHNLWDLTFRV